jgi:arylsulfatase A-like enzyme
VGRARALTNRDRSPKFIHRCAVLYAGHREDATRVEIVYCHRCIPLLAVLVCMAFMFDDAATGAEPALRPNVVFILMDDLRWDDLGCAGHPFVKTPNIDRIAREGALFKSAFATTPLCSPSRASFLTGRYPHSHGITDNVDRSALSHQLVTWPLLLHRAGYETGYVGKWHMGIDDTRRPGFDYWVCVKGQGTYNDPELNEDGRVSKVKGYVTDIFNDRAVAFLNRPHTKPFLLYIAHKAVHPDLIQYADGRLSDPSAGNFVPAERHKDLYADQPVPRRPNVADQLEGKPALRRPMEGVPPLGPATGTSDETIRNRLRVLLAVDEGVGRILAALEQAGKLDETLVVFTSDHGYFYGEHGLSVERRLAYEESIRIPLLMRYPRLLRAGVAIEPMVLSIDLAPTMLELGGGDVPSGLHGRSLVPLLAGREWRPRSSVLIEYFSATDIVFPRMRQMAYQAVRGDRWKYIHYTELSGMDELYDLESDPYEMHNMIAEPSGRMALTTLQAELNRRLAETR